VTDPDTVRIKGRSYTTPRDSARREQTLIPSKLSCGAWSHPWLVDLERSGTDRAAQAAYTLHVLDSGTIYLDGTEVGRAPSRRACCDQPSRPSSPVAAARHGRTGQPVGPLPGAAAKCAPRDVRRHFAAVSIDDAQYPLVAEFAGRLAQDHAEQEFTDGLLDLLDRLTTHPGAVQVS